MLRRHPANPIIPVVRDTWRNFVTANADVIRYGEEWRLYFRGNVKQENGVVNAAIGLLTCPAERFDGVTWQDWVEKAQRLTATDQEALARDLVQATLAKRTDQEAALAELTLIT